MKMTLVAVAALAFISPVRAEVVSSGDDWFELSNTGVVPKQPDTVWRALIAIPKWWDATHTYSKDGRNLRLTPKAGGCFCEIIPKDGSQIEHGRVVYLRPGKAMRLYAALGPLQALPVVATLTWTLKPVPGGTEVTQSYLVAGHFKGGLAALAAPVNAVMTGQFDRMAAYAGSRN